MNRTVHKKLTAKHHEEALPASGVGNADGFSGLVQELKQLQEDLLQPRPQAIANILKMAKSV